MLHSLAVVIVIVIVTVAGVVVAQQSAINNIRSMAGGSHPRTRDHASLDPHSSELGTTFQTQHRLNVKASGSPKREAPATEVPMGRRRSLKSGHPSLWLALEPSERWDGRAAGARTEGTGKCLDPTHGCRCTQGRSRKYCTKE